MARVRAPTVPVEAEPPVRVRVRPTVVDAPVRVHPTAVPDEVEPPVPVVRRVRPTPVVTDDLVDEPPAAPVRVRRVRPDSTPEPPVARRVRPTVSTDDTVLQRAQDAASTSAVIRRRAEQPSQVLPSQMPRQQFYRPVNDGSGVPDVDENGVLPVLSKDQANQYLKALYAKAKEGGVMKVAQAAFRQVINIPGAAGPPCLGCGTPTFSYADTRRSADEAMERVYVCRNCRMPNPLGL